MKTAPSRILVSLLSVAAGICLWWLASWHSNPMFLPSPIATLDAAIELWEDGTLLGAILASAQRILTGWSLGLAVGIPLGLLMGYFRWVRIAFDPYIEFFRFIPPIAFVTLAVIWFGPGEASKVALIFYTTVFIVVLNMIAGVQSVHELRLRAASSLGAGELRKLTTIVLPSTVPYMVTGARLAMGNSFLTIVSAEIVAAQEGLGSLIWIARNYARTEWVFVGIIALGILGFVFDATVRALSVRLLSRYGIKG